MKVDIFEAKPELRLGKIIEVSGSALKIELDIKFTELTRSVNGRVYPVGQIGSIIKIHFGRKVLFAFVRMLRMKSDLLAEEGKNAISAGDDTRILEADLFGEGIWQIKQKKLDFSRGIETYPLPLQDAFICINEELENVYKAAESLAVQNGIDPMIPIGKYVGVNNATCRANMDKLLGHHCAVLGSTGSGKSCTVASVLHAIISHKPNGGLMSPRIVIIDPHGEYASAFGKSATVFRAYNELTPNGTTAQSLKLPYWLMSSDEFRSLVIGKTEFEATSQNNMIYQALAYSRMVQAGVVENVGDDPVGEAKSDNPANNKTQQDVMNFDRDKPIPFLLSEFEKHIDKVQGRKSGTNTDLSQSAGRDKVDSILKKMRVLRSNPQLKFIMEEHNTSSPTIIDIISQFVGGENDKKIKIIDISGLPNEIAGLLTALIGRLLFQYKIWQTKEERNIDPVLFVCEEAHRYVPNHGEAQYKEAQEAIRRIAREGRKYGLGLMLVSQRPADVESTVLSQCNSWFILRLTNSSDQEHVSKFLPDSLTGLTKMLSSLTRREAIFVGEAAALPSRIKVNELQLDQLPDSHDISFAAGWTNQLLDSKAIGDITERWTKQVV